MHWVKLIAEVWLGFGLLTVIVGLLWTSKAASDAHRIATLNTSSAANRRAEFGTTGLSRARSA